MLPVQAGYHWYSSMKIIVVFIFLHSRSVFQKTDSAVPRECQSNAGRAYKAFPHFFSAG